ncbi:MAG: MoxR family ATPase [Desulfotignum sp.]|nr:MoxR family ATPase [Desulfotignum sp.]MCF8113953.1 MoxR family ATPase [Desulfotignum sp.]MCF8126241.1 MoxR family ATPase [Desulfotignum sp.]
MTEPAPMMTQEFEKIVQQIGTVVLGKEPQIRLALACIFARGHLLIEDLPGIGKTTLAKVLARCMGLKFQRMQFTSDLLPGDILGMSVFDQHAATFTFHPGPIFTQVFLADEINRATPKSQSALLEAMEEEQVTIEGETRALEAPFFVIATQNPMEQAGTFALPESQMDRFLMRIHLGYPDRKAEKNILKGTGAEPAMAALKPFMDKSGVMQIQEAVEKVHVSDTFLTYLQDILEFTRTSGSFQVGLSPRAGLSLSRAARAWAYLHGRDHTLPEDLQQMLPWVAGHRLRSGRDLTEFSRDRLMDLLKKVPVPI